MIQAGDSIGPYTLVRTLGRGAFGEVWLAERRSSLLTTQVALKLPLNAAGDLDAIRQEAQVWLKASGHTNIVPVLDAEIYDGQVVIASEFVAGGSLSDWLNQHGGKAPSVEAAFGMVRGILDGLQHLHESGLIHRDLKPGNVLVQKGRPRLTDFGLTRLLKPSGNTSNLAGTPAYMAPEAFSGQYSPASDVWAAGIVLHELLTGAVPYPQTDLYSLLLTITSDQPVVLAHEIPDGIRRLLARALAKPPAGRFVSASEMAEALHSGGEAPRVESAAASPLRANNNLPVQVTSFIGKDAEIAEVQSLLATTRLLTLTGPGGTGKTRLLLQAAATLVGEYADGVWLVELDSLSDPSLVPQAVATALDVREEPGNPLTQTLVRAMQSRKLLLLMDNCEHVLNAAAALTDALLTHCPGIKVLASSREGLATQGERICQVQPLSLPSATDCMGTAGVADVLCSEAVRLFADRAAQPNANFAITPANASAVARICCRLDGIPFAIELAAARTRSLSVEQIANRLHDRFHLLTGGSRTALPRQQTLRALIDWSYDLLTATEQYLFRRLCVFAGGWTLEAAEKACAGDCVEVSDVLDLLTALVHKSLVVYVERAGEGRYRLLETVRQYAGDRVSETGEEDAYREQHCKYYLAFAEEAEHELQGSHQTAWLHRIETEHDNLRNALAWCQERSSRGYEGMRLAAALWRFWMVRGYATEGERWLTRTLATGTASEPSVVGSVLTGLGSMAWLQVDYVRASEYHRQALAVYREVGDRAGIAFALNNLAVQESEQGKLAAAASLYEQGLAIAREVGDASQVGILLVNLSRVYMAHGDFAAARSLLEESLSINRELRDQNGLANTLGNLGDVAVAEGDHHTARSFYEESLKLLRELGNQTGIASALNDLANVAIMQTDYATARSLIREALVVHRQTGGRRHAATSLESCASLISRVEKQEHAVRLWGAAERLREEIGSPLPANKQEEYKRDVAAVRRTLGENAFVSAWTEGRGMTMEQAIELALINSPLDC